MNDKFLTQIIPKELSDTQKTIKSFALLSNTEGKIPGNCLGIIFTDNTFIVVYPYLSHGEINVRIADTIIPLQIGLNGTILQKGIDYE